MASIYLTLFANIIQSVIINPDSFGDDFWPLPIIYIDVVTLCLWL